MSNGKGVELKRLGLSYERISLDQSLHGSGADDVVEISLNEDTDNEDGDMLNFGNSKYGHGGEAVDKYGYYWESMTAGRLWTSLTFGWMRDILELGATRPLMSEDLYALSDVDKADFIFSRFEQVLDEEKRNETRVTSLAYVLFKGFGGPFMIAGLLKGVHDCLLFVGPYLLHATIIYLKDTKQPISTGATYVALFFLSQLFMSVLLRQYFWWCYRVGMHLRSAVVTSVYDKAMRLSHAALSKRSVGEITNLMSLDATRLQDLTPYLHAIWYSFLQITLALGFLFEQVGAACLAGTFIIVCMIPITASIGKYLRTLQSSLSKIRDERVKLNGEIIAAMKVIKFQAWEGEFIGRIMAVRDRELSTFRQYIITQSLSGAVYTSIPLLVSITTFAAYIGAGNELDVETALTSLALFQILQFPLFMLPNVINNVIEANVSVTRVESFLFEPEKRHIPSHPLTEPGVSMVRASLAWEKAFKGDESSRKDAPEGQQRPSIVSDPYAWLVWQASAQAWVDWILRKPTGDDPMTVQKLEAEYDLLLNVVRVADAECELDAWRDRALQLEGTQDSDSVDVSRFSSSPIAKSSVVEDAGQGDLVEVGISDALSTPGSTVIEMSAPSSMNPLHVGSVTRNLSAQSFGGLKAAMGGEKGDEKEHAESGEGDRLLALSRITLRAASGDLVAIVGAVGSGKSSLLAGLLGEIRRLPALSSGVGREDYGSVAVRGRIAFVGQRPFIQNATLRDNILFGMPCDEAKYQWTIDQAALRPDLRVLDAGDATEIGERGINLSGGQKARVALARAVYADADVYLLDDTLAAVDSHVGQHLFDECIMGLKRRNKCVIFVTNSLHFLRPVSHIVVLRDGRVAEEGSYDHLSGKGGVFADLLAIYQESASNAMIAGRGESGTAAVAAAAATTTTTTTTAAAAAAVPSSLPPSANGDSSRGRDRDHERPWESLAERIESARKNKEEEEAKVTAAAAARAEAGAKDVGIPERRDGALLTVEDREVGEVTREVYLKWLRAAGGVMKGVRLLALFYAAEGLAVLASWWLSYWSEKRNEASPWYFFSIYCAFNLGVLCFSFARELYCRLVGWSASKLLFSEMLGRVLHTDMAFFDTTPLGRIINRFSKDFYTVDEQIPGTVRMYLSTAARVTGVLLYICIVTPMFIVGLIPIVIAYFIAQRYFIATQRELTRLDSTSRSPIYALFSETLDGLQTIRAYGAQNRLRARNSALLDANQQAFFLKYSANCWLAVRLEFAGTLIVTMAALFAVIARDNLEHTSVKSQEAFAGMAGLAISLSLSVTQSLNWSVRMASDLESQMISVERIDRYVKMPSEAPHHLSGDRAILDGGWPERGALEMSNVKMRYRPGLPYVLRGVTLSVKGGEKVGIVGRTGAGKSTLVTALLRLVELDEGAIRIDGVDVSSLGLNTLRSMIAVIPQDPVLFSGTVRTNLDPFGRFTDEQLWDAVDRTLLRSAVSSLEDTVEENGANYSVGQRQLLCIARAFLDRARLIIMDEATASVDVETDASIQRMIRQEFTRATCLTVAHRLNTIMDSDKVLVMDAGIAAEFDTPQALHARPGGSLFRSLVDNWEASNDVS